MAQPGLTILASTSRCRHRPRLLHIPALWRNQLPRHSGPSCGAQPPWSPSLLPAEETRWLPRSRPRIGGGHTRRATSSLRPVLVLELPCSNLMFCLGRCCPGAGGVMRCATRAAPAVPRAWSRGFPAAVGWQTRLPGARHRGFLVLSPW